MLKRASEKKPRRMVEYWAHVQAFMPVDLWPVMQHRIKAAYAEPGAPPETVEELAAELRDLASWLKLDDIVVEPKGDLAPGLWAVVHSQPSPLARWTESIL